MAARGTKRGCTLIEALAAVLLVSAVSCKRDTGGAGAASTLKIAVVPKGTTHEFWKSVHAGAVKASQDAGVDIEGEVQVERAAAPLLGVQVHLPDLAQ